MQERERYDAGALPPKEYRQKVLAERKRLDDFARSRNSKIHPVDKEEFRTVREATIQSEIKQSLRDRSFLVWKGLSTAMVRGGKTVGLQNGVPDLFALRDGVLFAIEVKRPCKDKSGRKVSGEQRAWIRWLREHGAHAIVAHSAMQVEEYLNETIQLTDNRKRLSWPDY